jgi:hypothetical protein
MPLLGPDFSGAREQGRKVGEELFQELVRKHQLSGDCCVAMFEKQFDDARKAFIGAVEDLFEANACAAW